MNVWWSLRSIKFTLLLHLLVSCFSVSNSCVYIEFISCLNHVTTIPLSQILPRRTVNLNINNVFVFVVSLLPLFIKGTFV